MLLLELSRWQICFIEEFNPVKSRQDGQRTRSIVNPVCQALPLGSVLQLSSVPPCDSLPEPRE